MSVDIRRAADREVTRTPWLDSRHSFSYGAHYDAANTHFGVLLVCNEDVLTPGAGFDEHPHRDVEVITWVLSGVLEHTDSAGHRGRVRPGTVQRMSAGGGVRHRERTGSDVEPVHFVQMWVAADEHGGDPEYEHRDVAAALVAGGLVAVVSGRREHAGEAVGIRQRDATLHVGRPRPGDRVLLPAAPARHLFVSRGTVQVDGAGSLSAGDAARVRGADPLWLTAGVDAEVLLWTMPPGLVRDADPGSGRVGSGS